MKYNLVKNGDEANITVLVDGEMYVASSDSHPNFKEIVAAVLTEDESIVDLFDISKAVAVRIKRLSERVTLNGSEVLFDGVAVDPALSGAIKRYVEEGAGDEKPLVAFLENVGNNVNDHSREQLYRWLAKHEFAITAEGNFIAYKGVRSDLTSVHAGPAIVDGVAVNGHVPNNVGSVIEIARDKVVHDPGVGCASGLHAGTWSYASNFGSGKTLKVSVNPRDVVSVPTDCGDQKIRTSRYTVLEIVDAPVNSTLDSSVTVLNLDDVFDNDWKPSKPEDKQVAVNYHNVRGPDGKFVARNAPARRSVQRRDSNGRFI